MTTTCSFPWDYNRNAKSLDEKWAHSSLTAIWQDFYAPSTSPEDLWTDGRRQRPLAGIRMESSWLSRWGYFEQVKDISYAPK